MEVGVDFHKLEHIMLYSISDVSNDYSYPTSRQGCDCYLFLEMYLLRLVEDFGGNDAPSGEMLGSSGGNGICGAAGATSSKKYPSDSACGSSTK